MYTVDIICPVCGCEHTVMVRADGFDLWQSRQAYIQDALPELSDSERESLLSGMCPTCQELYFD